MKTGNILILLISFFLFSGVIALGVTFDIHPPHPKGLFVELTSIGYSLDGLEISSSPLSDILGYYNGSLRYFLRRDSVIQIGGSYYDPFVYLSYLGQSKASDENIGFWDIGAYLHTDWNIGRFSLKTHLEANYSGCGFSSSYDSFNVNATWGKTFGQLGFYTTKNTELFAGIETGKVLNISANPMPESTEYSQFIEDLIEDLKDESFYVMSKIGFRWFYNDHSAVEIGYRYPIIKGFLRFIQGNGPADTIYNYGAIMQYVDEQTGGTFKINIPFITTDYYLSFSAIF